VLPTSREVGSLFWNITFHFRKCEVLENMRFLYKLSFFVIYKINPIDFEPKNTKKGKKKGTESNFLNIFVFF